MDNPSAERRACTLRALSMGTRAGETTAGGRLRVVAVFTHSFYAEDDRGALACFLHAGAEPGPLHILCADWRPPRECGLAEGTELRRVGSGFEAGNLHIEFACCRPWLPPPFSECTAELCEAGRNALIAGLARAAPDDSLVAGVALGKTAGDAPDALAAALLRETRAGVAALSGWLASPDPEGAKAAIPLLGLGMGLTPSGDDVLAGTLLTLHALRERERATRLGRTLLTHGHGKTNRISWAHLEEAARGHGAMVFHELLNDVLCGGNNVRPLLDRVARVGHTSGWDVALGMVTTLGWRINDARH